MIEIDIKYKVPLVGVYNAGVYECPYCDHSVLHEFYNHICGFSQAPIGIVKITECPHCHEKYYSHTSEHDYHLFLDAVEEGRNLYFK